MATLSLQLDLELETRFGSDRRHHEQRFRSESVIPVPVAVPPENLGIISRVKNNVLIKQLFDVPYLRSWFDDTFCSKAETRLLSLSPVPK
jgi:hypothetical protein